MSEVAAPTICWVVIFCMPDPQQIGLPVWKVDGVVGWVATDAFQQVSHEKKTCLWTAIESHNVSNAWFARPEQYSCNITVFVFPLQSDSLQWATMYYKWFGEF